MKTQQHIVKHHIFEINVPEHIDYHKLKNLIISTLERLVYPKLGTICDKYSKQEIIDNINQLEIDLGKISLNNVKSVLIDQLPKKFEIALIALLDKSGINNKHVVNLSQSLPTHSSNLERNIQTIKYFLNTGSLPWWHQVDKKSINTMLLELGKESPDEFKHLLLYLNKNSWHRLITQQNNYQLLAVIKNSHSSFSKNIIVLYQDIQKIFCYNTSQQLSTNKLRFHFWLFVFSAIIQNSAKINIAFYIDELITYLISVFDKKNLNKLLHEVKEAANNLLQKGTILHFAIVVWVKEANRNQLNQLPAITNKTSYNSEKNNDVISNSNYLQNITSIENKTETESSFHSADLNIKSDENYLQSIPAMEDKTETESPQGSTKTTPSFHILPFQGSNSDVFHFDKTFYIDNAGIILYWVYLKNLFAELGFLKKNHNEFNKMEAAIRATLLLNLFAHNNLNKLSEDKFILNKVLCGLPLAQPIPNSLRIKPAEEQIFRDLSVELIRSWPALGKITVEGFRDAFILRNAVLKNEDSQWLLHIEKKPQDVLLNKLPWSINVIKFPWMKKYIIVEW